MIFGSAALPSEVLSVSQAGFDYVELSCKVITTMESNSFLKLCHTLQSLSLPALFLNCYCPAEIIIAGPGFDGNLVRKYAESVAERAVQLGVKGVGIGSPKSRILPNGFSRSTAVRQIREFLTITADVLDAKGVSVALEPLGTCYCNFINSIAEAMDVLSTNLSSPVFLQPDFYNMEHVGEADMDLQPVFPQISHVHISDDRDRDPTQRSYLKPEKAHLHTRRIQRLHQLGYDRTLTLEIDVAFDPELGAESLSIMKQATGN